MSLLDEARPDNGVQLVYSGGNYCNETDYYTLTIQINCDEDATTPTYELDTDSLTYPCSPVIVMTASAGCSVGSLKALGEFFDEYDFIVALIMMAIGIFFMILGGREFKTTMFLFA